ncbi:MAG TPA: thioredoxin family protein [Kofleriaceae bacterium]
MTENPRIVSRAEWLRARKQLLEKEKAHTRDVDALAEQRRALPWVKIDKSYQFEGRDGVRSLGDLFAGKSQLITYHFMFGPTQDEGCKSCSMAADHLDRSAVHVPHRDVSLVAVSHAPWAKLAAFQRRMGWSFPWYSSYGSDFNFDFQATVTPEEKARGVVNYNYGEMPFRSDEQHGLSVFAKTATGDICHTYSSYGRGVEGMLGIYTYLDMVPRGRDEDQLPWPMAWYRHHDRYES